MWCCKLEAARFNVKTMEWEKRTAWTTIESKFNVTWQQFTASAAPAAAAP